MSSSMIKRMIRRQKKSHKGQNGRLLVIAGSDKFPGAAYLTAAAAISAMRAGTDLVRVATTENTAWSINALNPDIITLKLPGKYIKKAHMKQLQDEIEWCDTILIGPGLGDAKATREVVKAVIKSSKPKVIDADAIRYIRLQDLENAVITPHQGELELFVKNSGIEVDDLQEHLKDNILLVKGKEDVIMSKDKILKNKTGNEGMTVGGTGDVLAGVCAGFVSQSKDMFESAYYAAYLVGKIGDNLKKELAYGFLASDFLKSIAEEISRQANE